ncbi:PucR family transcriptional regulator [Baekduia soli]|uniref:PucR family transcriptional regulator n=1 Tax=Baekduia soli TaxID=496014 RepID=UPI00165283E5|nr:helix-turn-helix domain-containing protein [Baekduia soli]
MRWFEDLDLVAWALTTADPAGVQAKAAALLAPLADDGVLLESLSAYLAHNLNAVRAARALSIHPNSLRYRLARIEERLGCSLQDPGTIGLLHAAVGVLRGGPAA